MYKINESGCWIWAGATCAKGRYGIFSWGPPMIMAHRYFYELHIGKIPAGMAICHKCDVGLCVNPEHLFLGTLSDNMRDAAAKNRLKMIQSDQRGEKNGNAKYNMEFADMIRAYYEKNHPSYSGLAKIFGLKSKGHAHAIVKRKIWCSPPAPAKAPLGAAG